MIQSTLLCIGLVACSSEHSSPRIYSTQLIATQAPDCFGAFDRDQVLEGWSGFPHYNPTGIDNITFNGGVRGARSAYIPIEVEQAFTLPILAFQNHDEYVWESLECFINVDRQARTVSAWAKARVGEVGEGGTIRYVEIHFSILCDVPALDAGTWTFLAPEGAYLGNPDSELDEEKMVFEERAMVVVPQSADAWDACRF